MSLSALFFRTDHPWRLRVLCAGILAIHAVLLARLAVHYSPTVDEVGHLPAGLSTWEFGRFDLFRVNPPLVRVVAALPIWLAKPRLDWSGYREGLTVRPEWSLGRDFLLANGQRSFDYWTWSRWMLIPLSVLGGVICWQWASELYGDAAGVVALTLWCFSPTVLGYGALITPDLGAASLGVLAGYAFWRWMRAPTGLWTLVAGLTLGLAELTKMTWITLFAVWPLLWLVLVVVDHRRSNVECRKLKTVHEAKALNLQHSTLNQFGKLAIVLALGLYVLNVGYGLTGTLQRLGEYRFVSRALSGQTFANRESEVGGNRFVGTWLERLPVPLPRDYVTGLDVQKWEFERGKWSYLRGRWKHGGWWWYYLYAAAVKEPLGTWCLLGLAVIAAWKAPRTGGQWRDTLCLLAPAVVLFAVVSSQTGFNRYVRYVLPAFPFFYIWAAQAVRLVQRASGWWMLPVGGALAWSVGSSLWVYPQSLSYFNEAAGGPARGHQHLIDANVDWGQDLFALRDWLRDHPEAAPARLACQTFVPLKLLGLELGHVPEVPQPGWFIISRHERHRRSGAYAYFDQLTPMDGIGGSMDVYCVTPDDAERVSRAGQNRQDDE